MTPLGSSRGKVVAAGTDQRRKGGQERSEEEALADLGAVLDQMGREQLRADAARIQGTLFRQVMSRCRRVLGLEGALVAEAAVVQAIVASLVGLSESEPYGVRGGTLVVLFNPAPRTANPPVKVGRFPLGSGAVPTFELHLTLQVSTAVTARIRRGLANLVHKLGGKPAQVRVDPKFQLTKKKLYRSSCSTF